MSTTLERILGLVGKLDDTRGDETPRERFRRDLKENVKGVGQLRDYVDECLTNAGEQYNKALQDLVNLVGEFLGFNVTFGLYRGVQGQIGFDGHWVSKNGFHLILEVKTTEAYAIDIATLVGYVDGLISQQLVPDWGAALGLYAVGRPDPQIRQLENAIIAQRRTSQLRVVSVDSLLSLAELMNEYDVRHEDVLSILLPSSPNVDPVIEVMARLASSPKEAIPEAAVTRVPETTPPSLPEPSARAENSYWIAPFRDLESETAAQMIERLLCTERVWAFSEHAAGIQQMQAGDSMCFYAAGIGVVAHAKLASAPEKNIDDIEGFPWVIDLDSPSVYINKPTVIDAALRSRLDAFQGRIPDKPWSWFVQTTRQVSEHDFRVLTGQASGQQA